MPRTCNFQREGSSPFLFTNYFYIWPNTGQLNCQIRSRVILLLYLLLLLRSSTTKFRTSTPAKGIRRRRVST